MPNTLNVSFIFPPRWVATCVLAAAICPPAAAQLDPGPRNGTAAAGKPLQGLTPNELAMFSLGKNAFEEVDSVTGTLSAGSGLGPRFNLDSCAGCHSFPATGGSSPALNPQFAAAARAGAQNTIPAFLSPSGPVRVARFVRDAAGAPDGGVHDLFVVTGRADAAGCNIAQPDFAAAIAAKNIIYRIPTPIFGNGLIEALDDSVILANKAAFAAQKAALGIAGHENRNGNDGSLTRFGWKAQNKSLMVFAGEAYNVEQGVTNDVFPNERESAPGCRFAATPEDRIDLNATRITGAISDVVSFTFFMRLLAPPAPQTPTASTNNGQAIFNSIGCALCHTPALQTASSPTAALSSKQASLYSDLLLHRMGSGLADGIAQGYAAGDEFRTAPLWGLGQRLYFLHDGRAADLVQAVLEHASNGSEAKKVVAGYSALTFQQKQDLFRFLRSL